jgi:hypothetical protein
LLKGIGRLEEAASAEPAARWIHGVVLPILPMLLGLYIMLHRSAWIPGRGGWWHVEGWAGAAVGIAILAMALLMHFHCFWSPSERWFMVGYFGKIGSLLMLVAAIFAVLAWGFVFS